MLDYLKYDHTECSEGISRVSEIWPPASREHCVSCHFFHPSSKESQEKGWPLRWMSFCPRSTVFTTSPGTGIILHSCYVYSSQAPPSQANSGGRVSSSDSKDEWIYNERLEGAWCLRELIKGTWTSLPSACGERILCPTSVDHATSFGQSRQPPFPHRGYYKVMHKLGYSPHTHKEGGQKIGMGGSQGRGANIFYALLSD